MALVLGKRVATLMCQSEWSKLKAGCSDQGIDDVNFRFPRLFVLDR